MLIEGSPVFSHLKIELIINWSSFHRLFCKYTNGKKYKLVGFWYLCVSQPGVK